MNKKIEITCDKKKDQTACCKYCYSGDNKISYSMDIAQGQQQDVKTVINNNTCGDYCILHDKNWS